MEKNDPNQEIAKRLSIELSDEPAIQLAFLFGSQAKGIARPSSNIDVAVYLDPLQDEHPDDIQL